MDWANVTKIHTPPSAKRYLPPPPPDEHAHGADQNERGLWGRECQKRMSKVIADIAQRDGNVLFLFH